MHWLQLLHESMQLRETLVKQKQHDELSHFAMCSINPEGVAISCDFRFFGQQSVLR